MQPFAPHIYLGADDIQEEYTFVWVATGQPWTYTNWAQSEPGSYGTTNKDCSRSGINWQVQLEWRVTLAITDLWFVNTDQDCIILNGFVTREKCKHQY